MGRATEAVTPPPQDVTDEQPSPVEDAPKPATLISREQLEQLDAAGSAAERVERLQSALGVQHYRVNPRTSVWVDFCFGVLNFARDDARLQPEKVLSLLTLAQDVYAFATQPLSAGGADSAVTTIAESVPSPSPESAEPEEQTETKAEVPIPEQEASADSYPSTETKAEVPIPEQEASADIYPSVEAVYGRFREQIRQASGVMTDSPQVFTAELSAPPFSPMEVARIVAFFTSTFFRHLRAYQYVNRVPRPSVVVERPLPTETPLPPAALADATLQSE
jgi:hypothetical protein